MPIRGECAADDSPGRSTRPAQPACHNGLRATMADVRHGRSSRAGDPRMAPGKQPFSAVPWGVCSRSTGAVLERMLRASVRWVTILPEGAAESTSVYSSLSLRLAFRGQAAAVRWTQTPCSPHEPLRRVEGDEDGWNAPPPSPLTAVKSPSQVTRSASPSGGECKDSPPLPAATRPTNASHLKETGYGIHRGGKPSGRSAVGRPFSGRGARVARG